ncbi:MULTISPECIES: AAA family ATPase [unclassified Tolypothrix]|uniref:AAA family ATPase n=1 Tax=unclassified Tolypothrix TaxID=2649714 RepID=UPI0005EAB4DE|nr:MULTISPECIES: AAA family ATPase [unclassified Tolypothrix]BAY90902.1 hypothetical protein NIES3275_29220 [Microchaete diplosiphon NIES-3275]EKE99851.1 hypothetical protein FDUTEX481_09728 [Tolypothrix sp. PCC 7601]MBE9082785.1 AAA family ATPase [Tolypothrix sp. LEGE 11397]UYD25022.1 AAA family ATPase [Tolypothrix sp. PCC 7712]UYD32741.1 AAA family ATPase [Tolypothrix sp. PCC 7601]
MKVKITNLGVIEKAEIDLKPLTVFIGRNGTGKTWTAYTLASILGEHGFDRYLKTYINDTNIKKYPIIDNAIDQFIQEGNVSIDLINFAEEYAEAYINNVAQSSPMWMKDFLSTERGNFKAMKVRFDLPQGKQEIFRKIKGTAIDRQFTFGTKGKEYLNISKEIDDNNIYFNIISEDGSFNNIPKRVFKRILLQETFKIIHKAFYSCVYIFPTERNTFISFPFAIKKEIVKIENINFNNLVESDVDRDFKRILFEDLSKQRIKKQSEPVQSLIKILANAYIKSSDERQEEIKQSPKIAVYAELAELLEEQILQVGINFNEPGLENEIIFQASENTNLEMTVASSMIKELAPLVLCLRYLAEPDDLLIIDEPEMNLHPSAQVAITEFLAMLVHAGLNILITTHSPYIVDHLTNLMRAAKYENQEAIKERFYLERTEAFIPQDKVSVYLFEDRTAKNILNEEGYIDWRTFGDISDDISHIFP